MIGKVVLPKNLLIFLWIRCIMNFLNYKEDTSMALVAEKLSLVTVSRDDDWETVGPNNQVAITGTQGFVELELSAIFGGKLRSVVKSKDNKVSTTIQPFLLLPLDILPEAVHTIEDALHFFSSPELLEGYRISARKERVVSARKDLKL